MEDICPACMVAGSLRTGDGEASDKCLCTQCAPCPRCDGDGYIETCRADGEDCRRETCPTCGAWDGQAEQDQADAAYGDHIDRQIDRLREGDL
jgi:hypothetical protein